ncbi:hypothetical protein ACF1CG_11215 [Streptomyces sp. NPDC014773]|uniref:hypothetical protein n=1 Tax=Streptomyces sp. NPDC014773 TaxID=3364908 RepID=UPI0036F5622C
MLPCAQLPTAAPLVATATPAFLAAAITAITALAAQAATVFAMPGNDAGGATAA